MNFKFSLILVLLVAIAVLVAPSLLPSTVGTPERLGQIKDFTLLDDKAEEFSTTSLQGNVWVANFFFTNCRGVCPFVTKNLKQVLSAQMRAHPDLFAASISVDPSRDDSNALQAFRDRFSLPAGRWNLLTGEKERIDQISKDILMLPPAHEPVSHTTRAVLIDRQGYIRGYYSANEEDGLNSLARDLEVVLNEKQ